MNTKTYAANQMNSNRVNGHQQSDDLRNRGDSVRSNNVLVEGKNINSHRISYD